MPFDTVQDLISYYKAHRYVDEIHPKGIAKVFNFFSGLQESLVLKMPVNLKNPRYVLAYAISRQNRVRRLNLRLGPLRQFLSAIKFAIR